MHIYIYPPILHKYPLIFSYVKYRFIAYRLTRLAPCQARLVRSAAGAVEAELGPAESQVQKMHWIFSPNLLHDMCRKIYRYRFLTESGNELTNSFQGHCGVGCCGCKLSIAKLLRIVWIMTTSAPWKADYACLVATCGTFFPSKKFKEYNYITYMHLGIRKLWCRALIFSSI